MKLNRNTDVVHEYLIWIQGIALQEVDISKRAENLAAADEMARPYL